jgi:hypothetical protein
MFIRKNGRIIPVNPSVRSLRMAEAISLAKTMKGLKSPALRKNFANKIKALLEGVAK